MIGFILFWIFFAVSVYVHECMHLFTLRLYGYNGRFTTLKGKQKFLGFGVEPIGIKNNVIHAPEAIVVRLSPIPLMIPFMISIAFLLEENIYFAVILGVLMMLVGSSMDIKDSIEIYSWWIKGKKPYVWN